VKFSEFIKEHLGEWPGLILEEETGQQLGFHKGFWFHTIGQRSGLLLPDGPWCVKHTQCYRPCLAWHFALL